MRTVVRFPFRKGSMTRMLYRLLVIAKRQRNEAWKRVYELEAELEELRSNDGAPERE